MATSTFRDDPMIASRYLADQLSESERVAYESALEQDPEVLKELEATARLKVGLQRLREGGELAALLRRPRALRSPLVLAAAAALAAIVIGLGVWRLGVEPSRPQLLAATLGALHDGSGRTLKLVDTQAVFRKRADAYDAVVVLPRARGAIDLRVYVEAASASARFGASLERIGEGVAAQALVAVNGLQAAPDGFVDLYVDSAGLAPGRYQLRLHAPTDEPGSAASFVIAVVDGAGESPTK